MKRRTNEQICADMRSERPSLYRKRSQALQNLKKSNLSAKEKRKYERQYQKADKRLETIKTFLFKCSDKYKKLRDQKTKINKKKSSFKVQLDSAKTKTERGRLLHKMRELVIDANNVDILLKKGMFMEKGELKLESKGAGRLNQVVPAWQMVDVSRSLIQTGDFDTIVIDGEPVRVTKDNLLSVVQMLDNVLEQIILKQTKTKTPMVSIFFDLKDRIIDVSS